MDLNIDFPTTHREALALGAELRKAGFTGNPVADGLFVDNYVGAALDLARSNGDVARAIAALESSTAQAKSNFEADFRLDAGFVTQAAGKLRDAAQAREVAARRVQAAAHIIKSFAPKPGA